jgi:hypothetical protein
VVQGRGSDRRAPRFIGEAGARSQVVPSVAPLEVRRVTPAELARWLMQEKGLGVRGATRVGLDVVQWSIASSYVGHFVTTTEFASWSGEGQRTVERRSSRIRKVLTEDEFRWLVDELLARGHDELTVTA